jgi:cellobiose phosphorylase
LQNAIPYDRLKDAMEKSLWRFMDERGTFVSDTADKINGLYFPLCNTAPIKSSVSPNLHGDLKTDFNSFLLEPVSRISLENLRSSRNFWAYLSPHKIWSATGVAKNNEHVQKYDAFTLEAGLLWHKVIRKNKKIGLESEITSFIPASGEPVEIMSVTITNISSRPLKFTPTAAIPIFGRSANNLHDHRHVTSLLQRVKKEKFGIIVKPTLSFNESGHKKNSTCYFVFGIGHRQNAPQYLFPTQEEFAGEGSSLESPDAVFKNLLPQKNSAIQGKEAIGALRFKAVLLKPEETVSYIILMGITKDERQIQPIFKKFNTTDKITIALRENKACWQKKCTEIQINTKDNNFDNWIQWVNLQPTLRRIFGCSFLPDFDYGKGGRGWRDLWQDCLLLILNNSSETRQLLINNFCGVRIDGSNATIIGKDSKEFIADRNNISRVWMDHGIWPLFTTQLYLHQTADFKILLEEATYFKDRQLARGKEQDLSWLPKDGNQLKTKSGEIYKGTVLEHILIENLVQFFNVGPHNFVLLEGADWNDGLDMAPQYGESVAFSAMYAQGLKSLIEIIERLGEKKIAMLKEASLLLDTLIPEEIDYSSVSAKRRLLEKYFNSVRSGVSDKKIDLDKTKLILDLKKKTEWMYSHIRKKAWLREGFFNGYYNNDRQKVEGKIKGRIRMTLAGQTFPLMSGIATEKQAKSLINNTWEYLKDKKLKGFHLNTDFEEEQLNLGRAFSFVYGDKENGAFFNHMCVMFAYALYKQGFARQGYEVINSTYTMALNTPQSKIYPCLPEYFNAQGRGMYSYLTGSASWFMFTLLTQSFGIRGEYGDLIIEPKLTRAQFKYSNTLCIKTGFAQKAIEVKLTNRKKKDFGSYFIRNVKFNSKNISGKMKAGRFIMKRRVFLSLAKENNLIEVTLN